MKYIGVRALAAYPKNNAQKRDTEEILMYKLLLFFIIFTLLFGTARAWAAEDTDMSKVTCKEFLSQDKTKMLMTLTWLDGYMSAQNDNTVMSTAWMEKLGTHIGAYCVIHPNNTIMDAVSTME